jgi:F-type H+-transporting ATPase subunit a
MGPHLTWFELLPGYTQLRDLLQEPLGRKWTWQLFQATHFEITHILVGVLVALLLTLGAAAYRGSIARLGDQAILPPPRLGTRAVFEGLADAVFGILEGVMGPRNARRFLPLLGSLFLFILFCNLISLVPGFRAPTDTLKTNVGLAVMVFLITHILGFREHGWHYLEQFTGHLPLKSGLIILVPLIVPIEIISHLIRPVTLSLRLMANMYADHAVASAFFVLVPFLVPVMPMALGVFISVVQALVFTLMSATYISLAIAHEEEH